jgi:hypothetical protein
MFFAREHADHDTQHGCAAKSASAKFRRHNQTGLAKGGPKAAFEGAGISATFGIGRRLVPA